MLTTGAQFDQHHTSSEHSILYLFLRLNISTRTVYIGLLSATVAVHSPH